MKVFERYASGRLLELPAPGISDGFYKALTLLTALESEPSLLVVDEVENSLHAKGSGVANRRVEDERAHDDIVDSFSYGCGHSGTKRFDFGGER